MDIERVEDFNLGSEIKRQQERICYALNITEKVLEVLRGANPKEDSGCMKDECIIDTLRINNINLSILEKNIEEIMRKIVG